MQTLLSWARWFGALSIWPLDQARSLLQRQAMGRHAEVAAGVPTPIEGAARLAEATHACAVASLNWPFDLARAQHAAGVQAGLLERSLLASAAFERRLGRLERLVLGPLARRV